MTERFRITLAQLNPCAGDIAGNAAVARSAWAEARDAGADLIAFPERFLTGEAEGLLRKPAFLRAALEAAKALARDCAEGPALAIGAPWEVGNALCNGYLICKRGEIAATQLQHAPPRGSLFDSGPLGGPYSVGPLRIGSPLGEDARSAEVAETLVETGAELLLVPDMAAYRRGHGDARLAHMVARGIETGLPVIYLNAVGGQGEAVCDGGSFGLNLRGALAFQRSLFEEGLAHVDLLRGADGWEILPGEVVRHPEELAQEYRCLALALHDFMRRSGAGVAAVELSETPAAALVACLAADALGAGSLCCFPVCDDMETFAARLSVSSKTGQGDAGEALPEGDGDLLLFNGTRTEAALGADGRSGDYAPLKDISDSRVVELLRWRNNTYQDWMQGLAGEVVSEDMLQTPDTERDAILSLLIDLDGSLADCQAAGHDPAKAAELAERIVKGEAARRRWPPGPVISPKSLWQTRYPLASGWRGA
ncbi:nitrilase-related carbon-nitrogen hydrolase [Marinovum sp.]|uniref:nitrilase-related carbon-nitrogen hydrolase n=1 Tax=Marinovum sp. TaxID=2024839 RepID=UPI003A8FDDC1